ncbi:hypothetical protein [Streptomyces djakartensis]|uniref:Lipoprotein n=1 Tax=Streptomyces djakartensis TaxID=68193 RepID=A0ABQ3A8X0_9ACTN|nr:hypothetical protein [Streptomyces djakartensis]GGY40949.1 hypothetical protein GCM10010384_54890 [Streptomyces djakartensis]
MQTSAKNAVRPLLILALLTVVCATTASCADDKADKRGTLAPETDPAPARTARAHAVAKAWDGSSAAAAWRNGYYPMGETVQLPETGLHNKADQQAFESQNFVLQGDLPEGAPKNVEVTWSSGGSIKLPLLEARTAFEAMDRNGAEQPRLVVTGAKLGEMTVPTSRGKATVPAWLFTVQGYDTPLRRTAVAPSKLPDPPITSARQLSARELEPLRGLSRIAEDGRSVTVTANQGSCDNGSAIDVWETSGSVVLSAYLVDSSDGPCSSELRARSVTVKLDRPVGDRVLLDAYTGRPVPYREPNGPSPS